MEHQPIKKSLGTEKLNESWFISLNPLPDKLGFALSSRVATLNKLKGL
jgi:hypothetical protein